MEASDGLRGLRPESARRWRIAVIDGPNMPNLGARDPGIYGPIRSLADLQDFVRRVADAVGVEVEAFASNHEGEILEFIHRSAAEVDGYLVNPAGLTTYGEATRHALADSRRPYVEVHFTNLSRHIGAIDPAAQLRSRFTHSAAGLSMGMRQYSYAGALLGLALSLDDESFLGAAA
ncbi:MAG: type II 3-dehydroquinate dehydratase [Solirubrobacterales bacterium]